MHIHKYLALNPRTMEISCLECDETICDANENYREHSAMRTGPVADAGVAFIPPENKFGDDTDLEFREFFCPSCGVLLQTAFAKEDDPILHDIEVNTESSQPIATRRIARPGPGTPSRGSVESL